MAVYRDLDEGQSEFPGMTIDEYKCFPLYLVNLFKETDKVCCLSPMTNAGCLPTSSALPMQLFAVPGMNILEN